VNAAIAQQRHVDDVTQIVDIAVQKIVAVCRRRTHGLVETDARQRAQPVAQQIVGLRLDPAGDLGGRRAAIRRVVLDAAVVRRIVRRRDDHAIGKAGRAPDVVRQDRVRNGGRRCVFAAGSHHDLDAVAREHFHRTGERRFGQRMRIDAEKQRAVDALRAAIAADCLTHGEHVGFVKGRERRHAAMARRAECHALRGHFRIGNSHVVRRDQTGDIDEMVRR